MSDQEQQQRNPDNGNHSNNHNDEAADEEATREEEEENEARAELAIIAYFHRLTTQILQVLGDIVDSTDDDDLLDVDFGATGGQDGQGDDGNDNDDDEETAGLLYGEHHLEQQQQQEGGGPWIRVDSDALAHMGLDVWSEGDAAFVRGVAARYFGRRAHVELKGVEVCGLKVC